MDEYLFLVMAKLKADRRKLEREQRERLQISVPERASAEIRAADARGRGKSFSQLERREQS
jgi:hypothetical protein